MAYHVLQTPLPILTPAGVGIGEAERAALERAWATARAKLRGLVERHPDQFPLYTEQGRWSVGTEAWTNWCEGFLAGQLWLVAEHDHDPRFRAWAERYSELLEPRKDDRDVHDLGFLFWSSWRRWYEATGEAARDDVVVHAGRTLALRFNREGRFLRSFLAPDSLFIDIMANVGVIFHAAARDRDPDLARVAIEHCVTTRRYLVRGDGSTSHEGIFDLETGAFLRQSTQQGAKDDGSWARGLSWALYGFGTAYRFTGDARFLSTARDCADFYIERTGERLVPPNDWEESKPMLPWESSAAAICAVGLWQLSGLVADAGRARYYGQYAVRVLMRLLEPDFLAAEDEQWEGILKHGIYHAGKGLGVDESVMWGDYFLLDAVDLIGRALVGTPALGAATR